MKIAAFIFTYAAEAKLLPPCIRALRRNIGADNELLVHVVDDSRHPLPATARTALASKGVTVLETTADRRGNIRGIPIIRETSAIMADTVPDADIVMKVDPDALVVDLEAFLVPLVANPDAGASGHNFGKNRRTRVRAVLGQAYAIRRPIMVKVARYLAEMDAKAFELAVGYMSNRLHILPDPVWEDYTISLIASMAAPLLINEYRWTAWKHGADPRNAVDVMRGNAVVLLGNPAPPQFFDDNKDLIGAIGDAMLAAGDTAEAPPTLAEDAKPLVVFGLGTGRDGTAYLSTLLGHQPGVQCAHQLLLMARHTLHPDPKRSAEAHWEKLARPLAAARLPVWGNVCLTNAWRVEGILPHLTAAGYDFRIIALDRDDEARLASWIKATDAQKAVMFGDGPSAAEADAGFHLKSWSHSTPHFPGETREERLGAYFAGYRQKVADLAAAHPDKVRVLPFADLNESAAIEALFDWLGLPATGRRLELLGTKVNPSPPNAD